MKYAFVLFLLMLLLGGLTEGDSLRAAPPEETPALPEKTAAQTAFGEPEPTPTPAPTPVPWTLTLLGDADWEQQKGERFLTALGNVHFDGKTALPGSELTYESVCKSDEYLLGTPVLTAYTLTSATGDPRVGAAAVAARLFLLVNATRYLPSAAFITDGLMLVCFPVQLPEGAPAPVLSDLALYVKIPVQESPSPDGN